MKKFGRVIAIFLTFIMAFSLVACGKATETEGNSDKQSTSDSLENPADVLVIGVPSLGREMFYLNAETPAFTSLVMQQLMRHHYSDAVAAGEESWGPQGLLAESIESSDGGLTWTIHLRKGVQWQGGYGEFTAADVDFTWREIMDPANEAGICYYFTDCDPDSGFIKDWTILDDYTIEVHLSRVEALFASDMVDIGVVVYCKKYIEEVGWENAYHAPIGTGPWVYNAEESISGDCIVFDRNDDYWGTPSDFRQLKFKLVGDSTAAMMMLQTGQIDMFQCDAKLVEEAVALGYETITFENVYNISMTFGGQQFAEDPQFDPTCPWASRTNEAADSEWNQRARMVREALCLAIDKDAILENIIYGYGTRSYLRDFTADMTQCGDDWEFIEYNPERAKQLLAEAGYGDGFEKEITFYVPNASNNGIDVNAIANACCDYLEAIGLKVDRVVEDASAITSDFQSGTSNNAWCMTIDMAQWVPDPYIAWAWSGYHNSWEYKDFWSPTKDEYLSRISQTTDDEARYALESELGDYLYSEYVECAIGATSVVFVHNDTVGEWAPKCTYEMTYNWMANLEAIHKGN